MDVVDEPTGTYSWRVSGGGTRVAATTDGAVLKNPSVIPQDGWCTFYKAEELVSSIAALSYMTWASFRLFWGGRR